MVTTPEVIPVTRPPLEIVASAVLDTVQTPPGTVSVIVAVLPMHIADGPLITPACPKEVAHNSNAKMERKSCFI
jgi:hypothetical protein